MNVLEKSGVSEELSRLKCLIKEYGGVDSYTTTQAVTLFGQICKIISVMGLNPENRTDFLEGVRQIFNLQFVNMCDFEHGKYVFVPNHVSEFDGILFGIIIPHMLVVAKSDWVSNPRLNTFIDMFFDIVGIVRKDNISGMKALKRCIEHLNKTENSAVTIFVQQTIADIDLTLPEDIASGAQFIAQKASAKIIPVYCEQVSTESPTRIVFGSPITCKNKDEFGDAWLRSEFELRATITSPNARPPILCEKHRKPISQREF